jgi:hypothetical protein
MKAMPISKEENKRKYSVNVNIKTSESVQEGKTCSHCFS